VTPDGSYPDMSFARTSDEKCNVLCCGYSRFVRGQVSDKPKYVEIKPRPHQRLEECLASDDPNTICDALYSAAQHEQDWRWSQTHCLKLLNHESSLVRSAALIALGEIALFRGHLDLEVVLPEIKRFATDPALGAFVEDALDNIRVSKVEGADKV